jgi:hypothetical protein
MSRRVFYGLGIGLVALAAALGFALNVLLQQRYESVLDKILLRADALARGFVKESNFHF